VLTVVFTVCSLGATEATSRSRQERPDARPSGLAVRLHASVGGDVGIHFGGCRRTKVAPPGEVFGDVALHARPRRIGCGCAIGIAASGGYHRVSLRRGLPRASTTSISAILATAARRPRPDSVSQEQGHSRKGPGPHARTGRARRTQQPPPSRRTDTSRHPAGHSSSARTSAAVSRASARSSPPRTLSNRRDLPSLSAMTFSSMVPVATSR
jgi:hypothetical protein